MAALADARRRAEQEVRLVVDETLGADSALGRQVLESYQQDTAGGGDGGAASRPAGGASGGGSGGGSGLVGPNVIRMPWEREQGR